MVVVARHRGRHRAQAIDRGRGAAEAQQRMRFEGVGERDERIGLAHRAGPLRRLGRAAGLDQGMDRGQGVGPVAVQPARLLELARRERPLLALRQRLSGLPATVGAQVLARGTGAGGSGKGEGHGAQIRRGVRTPARKEVMTKG